MFCNIPLDEMGLRNNLLKRNRYSLEKEYLKVFSVNSGLVRVGCRNRIQNANKFIIELKYQYARLCSQFIHELLSF